MNDLHETLTKLKLGPRINLLGITIRVQNPDSDPDCTDLHGVVSRTKERSTNVGRDLQSLTDCQVVHMHKTFKLFCNGPVRVPF